MFVSHVAYAFQSNCCSMCTVLLFPIQLIEQFKKIYSHIVAMTAVFIAGLFISTLISTLCSS